MFDHRPINWSLIAQAVDFYQARGFPYLEVPWIVGSASTDVTTPPAKRALSTELGNLVGSAEQSLIELMRVQGLTGRYVAASPCFRDEQSAIHQRYFFKVELFERFKSFPAALAAVQGFVDDALAFFTSLGERPQIVETAEGFDLELNGVEIGSYGARAHQEMVWTYGTGIAEPRFSYASGLKENNRANRQNRRPSTPLL